MVEAKLHPEQDYVLKIAAEIGVTPRLLHHTKETISCGAKLGLLKHEYPAEFSNWTLERVIKTLYFSRKD